MGAALGAFLMFTIMNVFAKLLSENHSVIEIAFYRNLIATLPFLFVIFGLGRREILVLRKKSGLVMTRAVLGTVSLVGTFAAFSMLPMADATVLLFASSLFIPILSVLVLHESVGPWRWAAVVIGFAGVLIMARPSGDVYALGIAIALGAAFLQAILQIILRHVGQHERPETITFYFFLIGTIVTALPLPFIAVRPTVEEIPMLLGIGLSGAAAQWLFSTAFRHASAAIVTVFNYSGIIWATLFGWLIWNDWPLPLVFVGATVVIASNILIIWRESRRRDLTGAAIRAKL
ncbi:MAG: DMT family transporter [Proteobacteria bacterium]|nr:DMT family transporter [Pseudomonadota bacterium]